ncbi:tyrosine-type recombinase/integrase [Vibrio alfacsensis]|uniref:tyrosine-type recombinase/integrase n=1 Tax=Vibrio alfacsensis TaxID=1074311 RepID=UPI004068E528
MYLYKNRYSVYYGRICSPKRLVALGFPFDFKFSLETKDRNIAVRRCHPIVSAILHSLDNFQPDRENVREARTKITSLIHSLKQQFCSAGIQPCTITGETSSPKPRTTKNADNKWQKAFIASKEKTQISRLSIHQLDQRTRDFLSYLKKRKLTLCSITGSDLVEFSHHLQARNQSAKTKKDYWQAAKQFVNWLVMTEHLPKNPFSGVTTHFRSQKLADQQRPKWSPKQLKSLLLSSHFQQASPSFRWTSLLLIHMGLRPSEACQLRISDVCCENATLTITDRHSQQKVKNKHALRTLPIHDALINMGFFDYINARKTARKATLFDWEPTGQDHDWSKGFRVQFGRVQSAIGMPASARPTAYGFRHTFIDALKQLNVAEHEVAEIVGHHHAGMTYGRYGKRLSMPRLREIMALFVIDKLPVH